jgi:nucleotide-binding universal stress UspA family protein
LVRHARFQPETILTAVAEGSLSDHAVGISVELCRRLGARLELIHAVALPPLLGTHFDRAQLAAISAERVGQARAELLAQLERAHPGAAVAEQPIGELLHVATGPPAKVVLDRAHDLAADLLVLGDSGKAKHMDFGGVAKALLGKAPCPIWMQVTPPAPIHRILAPVDLSEHSLAALAVAVDLAEVFGAEVTALHCFSAQDYAFPAMPYGDAIVGMPALQEIRDMRRAHFAEKLESTEWRGVPHVTVFGEDEPARGILRRQEEHDLIVIGTHGRTGLTAALLGGVAYHVMRSAHRPVLAIRQPDRPWLL